MVLVPDALQYVAIAGMLHVLRFQMTLVMGRNEFVPYALAPNCFLTLWAAGLDPIPLPPL